MWVCVGVCQVDFSDLLVDILDLLYPFRDLLRAVTPEAPVCFFSVAYVGEEACKRLHVRRRYCA